MCFFFCQKKMCLFLFLKINVVVIIIIIINRELFIDFINSYCLILNVIS